MGVLAVVAKFESEDDWFKYRLERDPRFLARIEQASASLRQGRGTRLEELDETASPGANSRIHNR